MTYQLLIRNGSVVDGSGAPRYRADVAVADGRIVEIGKLASSRAERVIDAEGRIVAPGFVDPHTHYDAQLWWDQALTPSPWHGVTTVLMGNCGVGIAPCRPAARENALYDLVNVEGIPYDVMEKGIDWDWESFPQFLEAAERRRPAINVAFLAPLTPFRAYVLGEAAAERAATPDETRQIRDLLSEAVSAGAFGLSTTRLLNHAGYGGRPLGCKLASDDEWRVYANILRDQNKGAIELALTNRPSIMADDEYQFLDLLLTESRRPVTWLALVHRDDQPNACDETLARCAPLIRRGGIPQINSVPMTREISLRQPHSFLGYKSWQQVLNKSVAEQKAIYGSSAFRNQFREELKRPTSFTGNWELIGIIETGDPALRHLEGKTIGQIAKERGVDGVAALLDVAIEDELNTLFFVKFLNNDVDGVAKLITNPDTLIGLSDGGAHISVLCDAGYCTFMLGTWVRERGRLSLEAAVKRITSEPADFFGIPDRGRLAVGAAADIVIFDEHTVGSAARPERQSDLPDGSKRFVMKSRGIDYTIVNGTAVYEAGEMTGAEAGRVLRSS